MRTLASLLQLYSAVVLIALPFLFHFWTRGDWRLTQGGRHVMEFMAGLAFVMCFAVGSLVWRLLGHGLLPAWVSALCWTVIAFVGTRRMRILHRKRYRPER